jgi:hypothetical protein
MQKQKPIKPVQKVVQQRLPDHPPLGITVLSSLFISDVLSYSSVGWCGDESILQAQPVCLCGLGAPQVLLMGVLIRQTWPKKMQSKMASIH